MNSKRCRITADEIGEVFFRLYESEIDFRFETLWDVGYRWALIGTKIAPDPAEICLKRVEIDDNIDHYFSFTGGNIQREFLIPHFITKDWLQRGADNHIERAVIALCNAATLEYPDCNFAKWYRHKTEKTTSPRYLHAIEWAEHLIRQLPEEHEDRNSWLISYGKMRE